MTRLLLLVCLSGCLSPDPYPDYFEDPAQAPVISGLDAVPQGGVLGGQELVITGKRLGSTTTVVIGTRNAEILDVTDTSVTVIVPDQPSFASAEDVVVVTRKGLTRKVGAFVYQPLHGGFAADETASAALSRIDCPIQGYGQYRGDWYPVWWCGFEQGWQEGVAWDGVSTQAGMAWDLGGYAPVSSAPDVNQVRVWGPHDRRPPGVAQVADYHSIGDAFRIEGVRNFGRDQRFLDRLARRLSHTYYWVDGLVGIETVARFYGEDVCYPDPVRVLDTDGDRLELETEVPADVTALWFGLQVEEFDARAEGGSVFTEGWTASARGVPDGTSFLGDPTGVELLYDDFSGYHWATGPGDFVGQTDVPFRTPFAVYERHLDRETALGFVEGSDALAGLSLPLHTGDVVIERGGDLVVTWRPVRGEGPSVLVLDLRVYDNDIVDPNYQTEVARLVATGDDRKGRLRIPASELAKLPDAQNRLDYADNFVGRWGDITVARHQLRKVPLPDGGGDLVLDFAHVLNAPAEIR